MIGAMSQSSAPASLPSRPVPPPAAGLSDHAQVGLGLAAVSGVLGLWALFWPVPTEVSGTGVLIYPDNAGILDARAGGQVRAIRVKVGERVRRGQVLMTLYLPVLERQLEQQRGNLRQLERHNARLDQRDAERLSTEQRSLETSLAKFANDRQRYGQLQDTFAAKLGCRLRAVASADRPARVLRTARRTTKPTGGSCAPFVGTCPSRTGTLP